MSYHCMQCGEKYDKLPKPFMCRGCSGRLFLKDRPEGMVKVVRDPVYCRRCGNYGQGEHPHRYESFKPIGGVETMEMKGSE